MISLVLQEAQARLEELRKIHKQRSANKKQHSPNQEVSSLNDDEHSEEDNYVLPAHIGWGRGVVPDFVRGTKKEALPKERRPFFTIEIIKDEPKENEPESLFSDALIYGEMAAAVMREGQVGAARIWWLLRGIDTEGKGWFEKGFVKEQLVGRVGEWRRIRQLLCEGNGLFWSWDGKRVWLRSEAKVAEALEITWFADNPVALPAEKLFGRIAKVKANLYAIFHSTREEAPISRATLQDVTGVGASTQRKYEEDMGIESKIQYALLPNDLQEAAYQFGHAVFDFVDYLGKHGRPGQRWTARQLPNCYSAPFKQDTHENRRRRLNRKLADLLIQGTVGNDWQEFEKVYYTKGAEMDAYFRGANGMWYCMGRGWKQR